MKLLAQLKKGTTVLAVLSTLERGEAYGYGIRRDTYHKTKGLFAINEGALYPLLHSLKRRGLVRARKKEVKGRERRYYGITSKGRGELELARHEWSHLLRSVNALLR
jgi:PadR family transcriptional regulator, regulatory protein PadR